MRLSNRKAEKVGSTRRVSNIERTYCRSLNDVESMWAGFGSQVSGKKERKLGGPRKIEEVGPSTVYSVK